MAQRKTLTEAQVQLLRWVGDGCPDGVHEGVHHRISVAALHRRGLVAASGHGDGWSARVTEAGTTYLSEVDGPQPPVPRRPNQSISDQLIADVVAAGGTLRVPKRTWGRGGVDWERRVAVAIERGKVPADKELRFHRLRGDEDEITLVDLPNDMVPVLAPVPVPEQVRRYHRVVQEFRRHAKGLDVAKASFPRVSRLLHALVVEAEARGYTVEALDDHRVGFTTDGHTVSLAVSEIGVRHRWESRPDRDHPTDPYGFRHYKQVSMRDEDKATGRLVFEYLPADRDRSRVTKWSDRRGTRIEEALPAILAEVPVAAAEARHRQREAERQAAERQVRWEAAMATARTEFIEAQRLEELDRQLAAWAEAQRIRDYAAATVAAHPDDQAAGEWVTWMLDQANELDPLTTPPSAPEPPAEFDPEDLGPYLRGRSPYGPDVNW